mmetsp:Transcript_17187/g.40351  ORF Transcript_17187/g.40351 Transcript_17187/m.40351 type:complete len:216 (+) Transcript_17187:215-862(+)
MMSSFPLILVPVMGHFISLYTQSFSTFSSTTQPDGLISTACSCTMECLETGQQKAPLPPPDSKLCLSRTSILMGMRSFTFNFLPDMGHLVAVSTLLSSVAVALGVSSLAQKLFSRCLALSTISNSPSRKRFSGLSSSGAPGTRRSLFSRARLCRVSSESRPWSAFWNASISRCSACCFCACSARSFLRSCSSYFLAFAWRSSFCCSKASKMNGRS